MKLNRIFRPLLATVAGFALITSSQAALVAYEGFDYSAGALGSASGGTGWAGDWSSNSTTTVTNSNMTYGSLETTSGNIGNLSAAQNRFGASRAINLTTPGLLANDAELWFSVMMGFDTEGNRTNSRLTFVLGTESMNTGNGAYYFSTAGATGLGVTLTGGARALVATQVRDSTFGTGTAGNVYGTATAVPVVPDTSGTTVVDYRLAVGRITWGATEDILDIFLPDTNLNLGSVHSTLTVNVDQSGYDTISFARGDKIVMDEIRFGSSAADVMPIPEPSAALLGGLGLLALLRRRR